MSYISLVSGRHDWDWMDCHHGFYVSPTEVGHDHCQCDEGWTGLDCSRKKSNPYHHSSSSL